jgi:hypothetical protein
VQLYIGRIDTTSDIVFLDSGSASLLIKYSKCMFAQQSLEYMSHVITARGIATDPSKIEVINKWSAPTNVNELRGFLGLAGYYKRFKELWCHQSSTVQTAEETSTICLV